jgi:hypothetical protein
MTSLPETAWQEKQYLRRWTWSEVLRSSEISSWPKNVVCMLENHVFIFERDSSMAPCVALSLFHPYAEGCSLRFHSGFVQQVFKPMWLCYLSFRFPYPQAVLLNTNSVSYRSLMVHCCGGHVEGCRCCQEVVWFSSSQSSGEETRVFYSYLFNCPGLFMWTLSCPHVGCDLIYTFCYTITLYLFIAVVNFVLCHHIWLCGNSLLGYRQQWREHFFES